MKLCNNKDAPNCGDTNYDPDYKFGFIYKSIFHNLNVITKWGDLDQSGDKTTWAHGGFGEKWIGLTCSITVKPGISKGGQIVITSYVSIFLPRFHVHRHKIHKSPPWFWKEVPNESRMLCERITQKKLGEEQQPGVKHIFNLKPHFTYHDYFSRDSIMNYLVEN